MGPDGRCAFQTTRGFNPVKWRICPMRPGFARLIYESSYTSNSLNLQRYALAARAFVHVTVCFYKLVERKHCGFQWHQHTVGRQLVDVTQGALQGNVVLNDAQLRLAGEVTDTVPERTGCSSGTLRRPETVSGCHLANRRAPGCHVAPAHHRATTSVGRPSHRTPHPRRGYR